MKIQTALALLWACLCIGTLSAQTTTKQMAQKAEQLRAIIQSVHQLPQTNTVAERGNTPKLDSTVAFVYFDTDSIHDLKTEFSEPAADVSIATTYRMYDNWALESRSTTITDDLGRTVTILGQIWNADQNTWLQESLLDVYPRNNSMTLNDSMFVYAWDDNINDWKRYLGVYTIYDNQDHPVESVTYFNFDLVGEILIRDELFYDANGDNYLVIQSTFDQSTWVPFSRIETEYEQHRPVYQTTFFYIDDVNYLPSSKQTNAYSPEGYLLLNSQYEFDFEQNDWKNTQTIQYTMDDEGRILSQVTDEPDPQNLKRYQVSYVYFSDRDLFSEAYRYWDFNTSTWFQTDKTYYYYSNSTSAPIVVAPEKLALSPNPTTGLINVSVPAQARLSILNAQGRPVTPNRLGETAIDLGHLPAGVYYLQILEAGKPAKVGAVVKQ